METHAGAPIAFTLVIPPEAFGDLGAHDMRVAFVPDNRGRGTEYDVPVLARGPSYAVTVNYAGNRFVAEDSLKPLDAGKVYPPGKVGAYLSRPNVFVNPPVETEELENTDISQVFTVAERVSLRGWVENAGSWESADEWAVTVFDNNEPIEAATGKVSLPEAPSGLFGHEQTDRKYAAEFNIPVVLDDEGTHSIRAFSFSKPFCRRDHNSMGGVNASNVVRLVRGTPSP